MTMHPKCIAQLVTACALAVCLLMTMDPYYAEAANTKTVNAQTATPTVRPGQPIIPKKDEPAAKLVIVNHHTEPRKVYANERFKLYIEVKNLGNIPASGFYVSSDECNAANSTVNFESSCIQPLPTIGANQSVTAIFVLYPIDKDNPPRINFFLTDDPTKSASTILETASEITISIKIHTRKPELIIQRYHTSPSPVRAHEPFDLHLEIKNVGNGTAKNLTIVSEGICNNGEWNVESSCSQGVSDIKPGKGRYVTFRFRYIGNSTPAPHGEGKSVTFSIKSKGEMLIDPKLTIHVLPKIAKPRLIIDDNSISHAQAQGPFDLHLSIRNVGTARGEGYTIEGGTGICKAAEKLHIESACVKSIPPIDPNGVQHISFRVRYIDPVNEDIDVPTEFRIRAPTDVNPPDGTKIFIGIRLFKQSSSNLLLDRYSTSPAQVRAQSPFILHLIIKNVGDTPSEKMTIQGGVNDQDSCKVDEKTSIEDLCIKEIPLIEAKGSQAIAFQLRHTEAINESEHKDITFKIGEDGKKIKLGILVLPALNIQEPAGDKLERFFEPDIIAKNISTPSIAFTSILTDETPSMQSKRFDLTITFEQKNHGNIQNIALDFCSVTLPFIPEPSCWRDVERDSTMQVVQSFTFTGTLEKVINVEDIVFDVSYEFYLDNQWIRRTKPITIPTTPCWFDQFRTANLSTCSEVKSGQSIRLDGPTATINTPALNIRSGPSTNYPVVGGTSQGRTFLITGKDVNENWWQIDVNGQVGWVFAGLVIATGGETVPVVVDVTSAPFAQTGPSQEAAIIPIENSGGYVGQTVIAGTPMLPSSVLPSTEDTSPVSVVYESDSALQNAPLQETNIESQPNSAPNFGSDTLLIIEQYGITPERPLIGEPFELEIVLRNIGNTGVQQVVIEWQGRLLVPLGTGAKQWMGDLPAGESQTIRSQFVLAEEPPTALVQLPIHFLYLDVAGESIQQGEQLTILWQKESGSTWSLTSSSAATSRSLWLRILLGLLGLGAEPR